MLIRSTAIDEPSWKEPWLRAVLIGDIDALRCGYEQVASTRRSIRAA